MGKLQKDAKAANDARDDCGKKYQSNNCFNDSNDDKIVSMSEEGRRNLLSSDRRRSKRSLGFGNGWLRTHTC